MAFTRICQANYAGSYAGQLTYIEYEILSNTSTTYTVRLQYVGYSGSGGSSWNADNDTTFGFTVNGSAIDNGTVATFDYRPAGVYRVFRTYDVTLAHGRSYGVSAWHSSGISLGTSSCSGSFNLPTLATNSTVTSMPATWNDDSSYTYSFTIPSSGRSAKLILTSDKASNFASFSLSTSPSTIALTADSKNRLWAAYPSNKSVTVTFAHCTYEGNTQVNIDWRSVTISCQNANPTAPVIAVTDTNAATSGFTGSSTTKMVKNYSTLQCAISTKSTGKKSATISKYVFTCGGVTKEVAAGASSLSVSFTAAKSGTVTCKAVDSRGNETSVSKTLTEVAYTPVSINTIAASRTSGGKGTNVTLSWTKTGTPTGYSYTWGPAGGTQSAGTVAIGVAATSVTLTHTFDAAKSYTITLTVRDKITTASAAVTVGIARVPLKFTEDGNIKIRSDALLENSVGALKTILDAVYPVGSIYMSVNGVNPSGFLGGTWVELQGRFLLGRSASYGNGSTGGASTVALSTAQMPSHGHPFKHGSHSWLWGGGQGTTVFATADAVAGQPPSNNLVTNQNNWNSSDPTGGNGAHDNMPPYLAVYMWKRTA